MSRVQLSFTVPSKVSDRAVIRTAAGTATLKPLDVRRTRNVYLDTADWRLLRGGWTLHYDEIGVGSVELSLREAEGDDEVCRSRVDVVPAWAADLPDGGLWTKVAGTIGSRRLLPRLRLATAAKRFAVLDDRAKTTGRVVLERHRSESEGEDGGHGLRVVTVVPVRGYARTARVLSQAFSEAGLEPQLTGPAATLAARIDGPSVGDQRCGINRTMPLAPAVSRVLGDLRENLARQEHGVRDQLDTEFLHEYRVAARRTRSIVAKVRTLFPEGSASAFMDDLRWMGTLTGPARDLDVQLSQIDAKDPELEPLVHLLTKRRREAQVALVAAMDSPRYQALSQRWVELEQYAAKARTAKGGEPAGPAIDRLLERAHRHVLKLGRAISESTEPEVLHGLRKKAKAFRYILEVGEPLYPPVEWKAALRELKALQDNLGEFQDCSVQSAAIRSVAAELLGQGRSAVPAIMAMGRMAEQLERREVLARREFAARFGRFSSPAVTSRLRRVFASSPTAR